MQCSPTSGSRPVRGCERYYLWQREIFRFKKRQMQHFQAYFSNCHYKILKEFLYIFLWFCLLRDVEGSLLFRNLSILSTIITKKHKTHKDQRNKAVDSNYPWRKTVFLRNASDTCSNMIRPGGEARVACKVRRVFFYFTYVFFKCAKVPFLVVCFTTLSQ
jgi:hypothetical protein